MNLKRILALTLALALSASLLSGCGGDSSSTSASTSTPSDASTSQEATPGTMTVSLSEITDPYLTTSGVAGDTVIGTVGEYEITADMYLYWLYYSYSYVLQDYLVQGQADIPWNEPDANGLPLQAVLEENAMALAAYYRLLPELGVKEGIPVNEELAASLAGDFDNIKSSLGSEELANAYFWANMMTNDLFQRLYMAGETNLDLQEKFFGEGSEGYPTDAEILEVANRDGYYRAKHILLKTVDTSKSISNDDGTYGYAPLDAETVEQKGALAEEMLERINSAQDPVAEFNALMKEHSEDEGLATYPDGYTTYSGTMVPEFEQAALALAEGELSGIVTSSLGYHIIQRLPLDPEEFRADTVADLMEAKSDEWLNEYGMETNENYEKIDSPSFCANALQLQGKCYTAVNEALAQINDTSVGSATAAQPEDGSTSQSNG